MSDDSQLGRFVEAQDRDGTYDRALAELRARRKTSHWMWFVFPQIEGLGRSAMAQHYALASVDEARAYLAHPVLGPRLLDCTSALLETTGSADGILGAVDAMKLRSSMTLFAAAAPDEPCFARALDRFFDGKADPATEQRLG
jgi:uncharacterized protein (DUF1810 family)